MRCPAVFLAALFALGTQAQPVWAAGDCPDGDWFCEPAPPASPDGPVGAPSTAPDGAARAAGARDAAAREASREPPPFEPPPAPGDDGEQRMRIDYEQVGPAHPRHRRGFREWGVNLHANVGLMGNDAAMSPDAGMNGFGGALRFRPIPYIAIEGAFELLWGTDYNGFQRVEEAVLANALIFANPRSAVQLYGIVGFGFGAAQLDSGVAADGFPVLRDEHYGYTGGQLGFGVEGRVTRHFALGADLLGFLRWRSDPHAAREPEFVDPISQRSTNVSAGGLLRLGATFYW